MTQPQAAQSEYIIYTFDMPAPRQKADTSWKRHGATADMSDAMAQAETLHHSRKFQKIEVKKKFFDEKKNRIVDHTFKVFQDAPRKSLRMRAAGLAGGALVAALLLYLLLTI